MASESGPVRTCVGCRRRRPQAELVRCALVDGSPVVSRAAPGRGAWLCAHPDTGRCLAEARRRGGFRRAWRTEISAEAFDQLAARLDD